MKYKAIDSMQSPRFSDIKTYMRLPHLRTTQDVDIAVVGIPFDSGATYRVGSRFGPTAIREISSLIKPYNPELDVNIFDYCSAVDYGDVATIPGYIEDSYPLIERDMYQLFKDGVIPIAMGGDHGITLGELRAAHRQYGKVALVHFDSHYDTWSEYFGKQYNHGTPFYHAANEGLLDLEHSIQVGIRGGMYNTEDVLTSPQLGFEVLTAAEGHRIGNDEIARRIRQRVGDAKVFLTFDVDFLDPAFAPGTGTPEVGGFSTSDALQILWGLKELEIIGFDVVEVAPPYDSGMITSLAAANLIMQFMSQVAYRRKHGLK